MFYFDVLVESSDNIEQCGLPVSDDCGESGFGSLCRIRDYLVFITDVCIILILSSQVKFIVLQGLQ